MRTFATKKRPKPQGGRQGNTLGFSRSGQTGVIGQVLRGPRVQAKLKVGAANDRFEREADQVADHIMRVPHSDPIDAEVSRPSRPSLETAQRVCSECQEDPVQTRRGSGEGFRVDGTAAAAIQSLKGAGKPLPNSERAFFKPRFGRSLEQVRIHAGDRADSAARIIRSRAFTHGSDIAFAKGAYRPGTTNGRWLMAHELAHVMQNSRTGAGHIVRRNAASRRRTRRERGVIRQLSAAIRLLGLSRSRVRGQGLSDLVQITESVAQGLVAGSYGVYDTTGVVDRSHRAQRLDIFRQVRGGPSGISRPVLFRVYLYLSHQTGATPAGQYHTMGDLGGRIVIFINRVRGRQPEEIAGLLAHEFFHMWAHYQRVLRDRHGDQAAQQTPTRATSHVVDPTRFASHRQTMERHFVSLIRFLNAQARSRGVIGINRQRVPSQTASQWGRRVVEEVGAYVYETCVRDAIASVQARAAAGASGTSGVSISRGFVPVQFLNDYISEFWLQDAGDRAALRSVQGRRILSGMSTDIIALRRAMQTHMGC